MTYRSRLGREQEGAAEIEEINRRLSTQLNELRAQTASNEQTIRRQVDELSGLNQTNLEQIARLTTELHRQKAEC